MRRLVRISTMLGAACSVMALVGFTGSPAGAAAKAAAAAPDKRIEGFSTWSPEDDRINDRNGYYEGDYYNSGYYRDGYRSRRSGRYDRYYDDPYAERRRDRPWREREYIRRPDILKPADRPNNQKWRRRKEANFSITTVNPHVPRGGKGVYRTIREAIDHTRPGGTVLIQPGMYSESLILTWPVYLRADVRDDSGMRRGRPEEVTIRPPTNQPCLAVAVMDNEWVKIRDLNFETPGGQGSQGCIVHRNGALTVQDSRVTADTYSAGFYLAGGSAVLENNDISSGRVGIYVGQKVMDGKGIRTYQIVNNRLDRNGIGVHVDAFDAKVILQENMVNENDEAGLIVAKGSVEARLNEFNQNKDDGVVLLYPDEVSLKENIVYDNGRYGLYMPLAERVSLTNNNISCNRTGGVVTSHILNNYDEDDDVDEVAQEQYPGNQIEFNPPERRRGGFFSRSFRSLRGGLTPEEICMDPPYPPQSDDFEEDGLAMR